MFVLERARWAVSHNTAAASLIMSNDEFLRCSSPGERGRSTHDWKPAIQLPFTGKKKKRDLSVVCEEGINLEPNHEQITAQTSARRSSCHQGRPPLPHRRHATPVVAHDNPAGQTPALRWWCTRQKNTSYSNFRVRARNK